MPLPAADVLDSLSGSGGRTARLWADDPLRGVERVLVLRIRNGTLRITRAPDSVLARPGALPVATSGVDGVAVELSLHRIRDLDAAFAELRRVLRPAGTLVVVTPSASVRSLAELRGLAALRPVRRGAWGHRAALDGAGWLLSAADFAVLGDDRVPFTLPLPDAAAAHRAAVDLPAAGLWPDPVPEGMAAELLRRAGPGCSLPVPLRRLVARR